MAGPTAPVPNRTCERVPFPRGKMLPKVPVIRLGRTSLPNAEAHQDNHEVLSRVFEPTISGLQARYLRDLAPGVFDRGRTHRESYLQQNYIMAPVHDNFKKGAQHGW